MISAQSIYTMATGHIPCLYQVNQTIQYVPVRDPVQGKYAPVSDRSRVNPEIGR